MDKRIQWLLEGDPAIVYQTHRDLMGTGQAELDDLRARIVSGGWGAAFLALRDPETGTWGQGLYSPKWVSTTYTMLDLKNLGVDPKAAWYRESAEGLLKGLWKIPVKKGDRWQDLCICGMLLNLCCPARIQSKKMDQMVDYILDKQFADGGWNCRWEFDHDHGSLHTTINMLEGIREYEGYGYGYRQEEVKKAAVAAHEFVLIHRLFLSDRTGKVIDKKMTMLSYPGRWRYDVLRMMDYFQSVGQPYDPRMEAAFALIEKKRRRDGIWPVQQKYTGRVHFDMEATGKASRWNTLRVLRVSAAYGKSL